MLLQEEERNAKNDDEDDGDKREEKKKTEKKNLPTNFKRANATMIAVRFFLSFFRDASKMCPAFALISNNIHKLILS